MAGKKAAAAAGQVLAAEVHPVTVNGIPFWIRELSLGEWDDLYGPDGDDADEKKAGAAPPRRGRPWILKLLRLTLVNEDGSPWSGQDLDTLPMPFGAVLVRQAIRINGLSVPDETVRKNSPGQAPD